MRRRITLVNDVNFMLYTPLLPGAAAGTLEPRHVVVPLREELERTDLRLGRVTGANPERNTISVDTIEGHHEEIEYDHLIVALGSVSRTLPIPGLAQHAIGFKTLSEAIALRNRVLLSLEMAESLDDDERRAAYLSYVFVGGGYSGVEGLAELQDFAADVIELYPRCRVQGMRWMLVEAAERPMMEIPPKLSDFTVRELRGRGIEFRIGQTVEQVTDRSVTLSTGEVVPARTVVWTAGVKPHPVVQRLGLPLTDKGRIEADRFMQVPGHDNVWAIGDAAAVPDPARKGQPSPPTAQHGLRQGRAVAKNVAAAIGRGRHAPLPLPHARRVRRPRAPPGGGQHAGHPLARVSRMVPRPDLPHGRHARGQAPAEAGGRLDGRPAVRPRRLRAGPARSPARA